MAYSQPPRISQEEFIAAQSCICFNSYRMTDGKSNMTPESAIAVMRGANYDAQGPVLKSDMMIADQAMRDLADYLGFDSVVDYNNALMLEGNNIFKRAKTVTPPPPNIEATSTYPFEVPTPDKFKD